MMLLWLSGVFFCFFTQMVPPPTARGAHLVGKQPDVINNTMNLLLRIANYVPQRCVFDLHLLALTLLLHLARPSQHNRQQVLRYVDKETNRDGFKALVAYFDQQEEKARWVVQVFFTPFFRGLNGITSLHLGRFIESKDST